ncbi:MAG: D-alanyl-D-alanine carboxypeptidase family protein [Tuberibacillus sp.]
MIKKTTIAALIFALVLSCVPWQQAKANQDPSAISVSAQSAILMDQASGRVLFEKDVHKKMRIASITKVMTAILAIESGEMDDKVKVSNNAYGTEGSSIYLKKGEKITLRNLVYGLMLRSGNDAAVAIAEKVGGSVDGFVYLMNQKAKEIGMMDTHFANPHGLDDHEQHYSTAYDMALLTRYAMQNKEFRKIFQTKYYKAPNPGEKWDRSWKNKNKLLFRYKYSTGGKTGYTKRAGRTLISTASKGELNLVVVTLNDGDDWRDHQNLFNWGFANYKMVKIAEKGKITGIHNPYYDGKMYVHRDLALPLSKEEKESLETEVTVYKPPHGKRWEEVPDQAGHLDVMVHGNEITSIPLFYEKPPKENKGFWTTFSQILNMILGYQRHD